MNLSYIKRIIADQKVWKSGDDETYRFLDEDTIEVNGRISQYQIIDKGNGKYFLQYGDQPEEHIFDTNEFALSIKRPGIGRELILHRESPIN